MTQFEFDKEMQRINQSQSEAKSEIYAEMEKLDTEKRNIANELMELKNKMKEIGCEMECKYLQISVLKDKKAVLLLKMKDINATHYDMKHQLINSSCDVAMESELPQSV